MPPHHPMRHAVQHARLSAEHIAGRLEESFEEGLAGVDRTVEEAIELLRELSDFLDHELAQPTMTPIADPQPPAPIPGMVTR